MSNMIRLLCLTVVGLSLLVGSSGANKQSEATLATVCEGKPNPITKITQARKLIEETEGSSVESPCFQYKESFQDLKPILEVVESTKICNTDLVDKIRQYHEKFIKSDDDKAPNSNIPPAVRYFFISLCFQINAECKMALINNLEFDTKEKIDESDYDVVRLLENFGATLLDSGDRLKDFDDIFFLSDIKSITGAEKESDEFRLIVKVQTNNMMRDLVKNCNNKFRPFYEKLILPLIGLSNLGYNYQGDLLARELEELKHNELVHRWYHIVQTCEAFRSLVIYEDTSKNLGEKQALTFISREEAEMMSSQHVPTIEEEVESSSSGEQAIEYEPMSWHKGDELWIQDQQELDALVKKYKASTSEIDRIKHKMAKKLMAKIKETIMSGRVFIYAKDMMLCKLGGGNKCEGGQVENFNENLVKMLDEAASQNDVNLMDRPVAGPKYTRRNGPIRTTGLPPRNTHNIPRRQDGTKSSLKLWNMKEWLLPKKGNLFFWMLGIFGSMLMLMGVLLMAAG